MKYVTIPHLSQKMGYTQDAIRSKIKAGVWVTPKHWMKAPDNRILLNTFEIERWIESAQK